jgi:hypothetical protein
VAELLRERRQPLARPSGSDEVSVLLGDADALLQKRLHVIEVAGTLADLGRAPPRVEPEVDRIGLTVEPVTSQKRMVTTFRSSRVSAGPSPAPQESQNRAPARFSWPHAAQIVTG